MQRLDLNADEKTQVAHGQRQEPHSEQYETIVSIHVHYEFQSSLPHIPQVAFRAVVQQINSFYLDDQVQILVERRRCFFEIVQEGIWTFP